MLNNIVSDARYRWRGILASIGVPQEYLTGKHTSCPFCGGKDRFRFDDKDGFGTYFCNGCGPGDGLNIVSNYLNLSIKDAMKEVKKLSGGGIPKEEKKIAVDQKERVSKILAKCKPVEVGDEVWTYLDSRGVAPDDLTAFKKCEHGLFEDGEWKPYTAMILRAAHGRRLAGIHATYLSNGKKVARRMYAVEDGAMVGSAVRLGPLNGGDTIVVGEGIETTLAASVLCGVPGWAAMDAGKMESIIIPEDVRTVIIAGDNDASFTGQAAAYALAKRLVEQKKNVRVHIPKDVGVDWNDVLLKRKSK